MDKPGQSDDHVNRGLDLHAVGFWVPENWADEQSSEQGVDAVIGLPEGLGGGIDGGRMPPSSNEGVIKYFCHILGRAVVIQDHVNNVRGSKGAALAEKFLLPPVVLLAVKYGLGSRRINAPTGERPGSLTDIAFRVAFPLTHGEQFEQFTCKILIRFLRPISAAIQLV